MKIATLLRHARQHSWDVACLTELHGVKNLGYIAIEEFIVVLTERCALLLGPRMARRWVDQGGHAKSGSSGRHITVAINMGNAQNGRTVHFTSAYAPPGDATNSEERKVFFEDVEALCQEYRDKRPHFVGGDWNSHMGSKHERKCRHGPTLAARSVRL